MLWITARACHQNVKSNEETTNSYGVYYKTHMVLHLLLEICSGIKHQISHVCADFQEIRAFHRGRASGNLILSAAILI